MHAYMYDKIEMFFFSFFFSLSFPQTPEGYSRVQ